MLFVLGTWSAGGDTLPLDWLGRRAWFNEKKWFDRTLSCVSCGPWSLVGATCHRIQPANPRRPKEYAILLASSATKNLIFPRRTQGLMRGSLSYRPLSSEWFVVIFFAWPTSTIGRTFSFPFHFFLLGRSHLQLCVTVYDGTRSFEMSHLLVAALLCSLSIDTPP